VYIADQDSVQIQKKYLAHHDKRHPNIVDIVYDDVNGNIWTAATVDLQRSAKSAQLDTQLCVIPATNTTVSRSLLLHGVAQQISVFHNELWILLVSGQVVAYNLATLGFVGTMGPFPSSSPLTFSWMAVPHATQVWIAAGSSIQIFREMEGDQPVVSHAAIVPGSTVLGITEASFLKTDHAPEDGDDECKTPGALEPSPAVDSTWSNMVACVLDNGTIEIWDSRNLEASPIILSGAPLNPKVVSLSPGIGSEGAFLTVATETQVHIWTIS